MEPVKRQTRKADSNAGGNNSYESACSRSSIGCSASASIVRRVWLLFGKRFRSSRLAHVLFSEQF